MSFKFKNFEKKVMFPQEFGRASMFSLGGIELQEIPFEYIMSPFGVIFKNGQKRKITTKNKPFVVIL